MCVEATQWAKKSKDLAGARQVTNTFRDFWKQSNFRIMQLNQGLVSSMHKYITYYVLSLYDKAPGGGESKR